MSVQYNANFTGNATYTLKFGFAYFGGAGGSVYIGGAGTAFRLTDIRLAAMELKK